MNINITGYSESDYDLSISDITYHLKNLIDDEKNLEVGNPIVHGAKV